MRRPDQIIVDTPVLGRLRALAAANRSFATGPVDSPPRRINTRPVPKGLHYKGVLDNRARASSTMDQRRGEASHGVHGVHGGAKCSFGSLIMHLINVLVREAALRQLHAENASSFRFNSYSLPPWPPCDDFFEFLSQQEIALSYEQRALCVFR